MTINYLVNQFMDSLLLESYGHMTDDELRQHHAAVSKGSKRRILAGVLGGALVGAGLNRGQTSYHRNRMGKINAKIASSDMSREEKTVAHLNNMFDTANRINKHGLVTSTAGGLAVGGLVGLNLLRRQKKRKQLEEEMRRRGINH